MKGRIITNWGNVDTSSPEGLAKLVGALNHFLGVPDKEEVVAALQHFALDGDFPENVKQILAKFHIVPTYDEGWRNIFDVRDFTGTNESGFKMLDVSSGLTFRMVKPGEKLIIEKMSGKEVVVGFDLYGGALGWHRVWFDDKQYWTLEDTMTQFQNKAMHQRAKAHYSLIEAIGSDINLGWQAPLPASLATSDANYHAVRDYRTINKACEEILVALDGKGMGVTPQSNFVITAPIQLRERIARAMGVANMGISGQFPGVLYNVTPQYTMMLDSTSTYYVSLPGVKTKSGIRMNLTMHGAFDNLSYTENLAAYQRYGAIVGEIHQHRRCAVS
jgi:hypothetical protein